MKRLTVIGYTVVMVGCIAACAMIHVKHDTYALIQTDEMGNDYITDQYLSWDDCMSQPHIECRPMGDVL